MFDQFEIFDLVGDFQCGIELKYCWAHQKYSEEDGAISAVAKLDEDYLEKW